MVERHQICMAISMDHMHIVSAPPITLHSGGQELCGPHGDVHCHATGWCYYWVYHYNIFYLGVWLWKCLTVTVCIDEVQQQGFFDVPLVLDWFITWYAILILHCNVVGTVTCTVLCKCLPVWLAGQICRCAIHTATLSNTDRFHSYMCHWPIAILIIHPCTDFSSGFPKVYMHFSFHWSMPHAALHPLLVGLGI
jgi:hypothetical protein